MNYNISVSNNQAFSKQHSNLVYWLGGATSATFVPEQLYTSFKFTSDRKKILICLLKYIGVYHQAFPSHNTIARLSGVHHDTVYRTIKLFVKFGILKKRYRGANKTCVYSLGSALYDPYVKWACKDILVNLYWAVESAVAKAKEMIQGLGSNLAASFNSVTARFSKENNKDINTYKSRTITEQKEEEFTPTQEDLDKYQRHEDEVKKRKDDYAAELAKLLNLPT
jgi:hypothetical protein